MKSNIIEETVYEETTVEDSFEGVQSETQSEFTDMVDENTEVFDETDYQEVSSMEETAVQDVSDEEDSFEGGTNNGERTEATLTSIEENTLEKVAGYDYSFAEAEASTQLQDVELPPIDAYYGSFGDTDLVNLMRSESGQKMLQEVVIGTDDRKKITATKKYPWRTICSLKIQAKDGTNWIGTGFLIGPRTVITAGHVVFLHNHGGWAKSIEVIPGRNGSSSKPFGSCKTNHLHSVKGWTKNKKRINDYGAIILPKNCKFGTSLGYFGFANYSLFNLLGLKVNLSGYPGDKPSGTQWWHCRRINFVTPRTLIYNIDTAGGQSGSPVWKYKSGKRYVVGIHTNGSSSGNSATRITSPVYKNLKNWKNMHL